MLCDASLVRRLLALEGGVVYIRGALVFAFDLVGGMDNTEEKTLTKKPKKNKPKANASQAPSSARPNKQTSHSQKQTNPHTPSKQSVSEQSPVVAETTFPPLDLSTPQLTVRAIATGMFVGALLSLCNIYSGLKIGWGFNMSVTAALLSYGFWQALSSLTGSREWNIYENNVNQTAASSAAMISSAGLVAPIPALTIMTGQSFSWAILSVWVFSVACVGVVVAIGLRRQMIVVDKLPFPSGIATAETLKQMYARGDEAIQRVKMLMGGAFAASLAKIAVTIWKIKNLADVRLFSCRVQRCKLRGYLRCLFRKCLLLLIRAR